MTDATLTFDGLPPLTGMVETGGDYLRFRTSSSLSMEDLDGLRDGVVVMDGASEDVVLESAHPRHPTPGLEDGPDELELTLRRIQPAAKG